MEEAVYMGGIASDILATQLVTAISPILRHILYDLRQFPAQAMFLSVYYLTNINLFIVFSILEV